VAVLSMLDDPFGFGVRIQPSQMRQAIQLLMRGDATNATILRSCG